MFEKTGELLIENFMGAMQTAFIYQGIIRGNGEKKEHHVMFTSNEEEQMASYVKTKKRIDAALDLILGNDLHVEQMDEFLLPNLVKVTSISNSNIHFTAGIPCMSTVSGNTDVIYNKAKSLPEAKIQGREVNSYSENKFKRYL